MKLRLTFITLLFAASLYAANGYHTWGDQGNGFYVNPILNVDYSDPDIIRVGEKYYMVASDFHFMGMQVLESEDMVNWKLISQIFNKMDFPQYEDMSRYGRGSWAPSIRYHEGKFWVYFCTPDEGLFMSTAEDPAGPWAPLHNVKHIAGWEDPCPFWDEDGQAYLGRSILGAGPIIIHRMSPDGKTLLDEGVKVYEGKGSEGTKIHKWNGYYYLSIPEGGTATGWQTVLRSKSIYGPYEKKITLKQGETDINGPHQGSIVDTPDGQWWFFHFQRIDKKNGRVVCLQPMHWEDGWPVMGVDMDNDGIGEPVRTWAMPLPSKGPFCAPTSDDFNSPELGLQWQFSHNPVDRAWSLTENRGKLTLHALKADNYKSARNTLTQKIVGYEGEATVVMDIDGAADGQRCGLAAIGKGERLLGVRRDNGENYLYGGPIDTLQDIAKLDSAVHKVWLRLTLDTNAELHQLAYSLDGTNFTPFAERFLLRFDNWKGPRVGLYCFNAENEAGKAVFDDFVYTHDGPQPVSKHAEAEALVAGIRRTSFPDRTQIVKPRAPRRAIQQAIDEMSLAGGGTICLTPGEYLMDGSLFLKSNVNLHLEKGANLRFSGHPDDYLPVVLSRWEGADYYGRSPMIYADKCENIAITGEGLIDARASEGFIGWDKKKQGRDEEKLRVLADKGVPVQERVFGKGTYLRPCCIEFYGCNTVLMEGVTVLNSPFWTIHPLYCNDVIVRRVTVSSNYANNDGCDPDSSNNVLIEDCTFNTGDDAIAIKSGKNADGMKTGVPARNIVIRNCLFATKANGLAIGSEMSGGVENVYLYNIDIPFPRKRGVFLKSNKDRGGYIRNIYIEDINIGSPRDAGIKISSDYGGWRGGNAVSDYDNIVLRNIHINSVEKHGIFIEGFETKPIKNVTIENLTIESAGTPTFVKYGENITIKNSMINGEKINSVK